GLSEREERALGATAISFRPPSTRSGLAAPATNEPTAISFGPPAVRSGLADPATNEPTATSFGPPAVRSGLADPATTDTIGGARRSSPKIRSADAIAACITVYLAPRSRIGRKKRLVYWMKATSAPNDSVPAAIWPPPYQISSASAREPSASTDA